MRFKISALILAFLLAMPVGNRAAAAVSTGMETAQQSVCKGRILDVNGNPLPGAAAFVSGTTNGAVSDENGVFTLNGVRPGSVIEISFMGYTTVTTVWNGNDLTITLEEDTTYLEDAVVIGYGVVRKADLAGSVAVLDDKAFKDQPVTTVSQALQGRVAGVFVEESGIPGGAVKIRVRGSNSIYNSNDPLYVVDGIVRESGLDGISPEDIQSIQVLKDASSTAIYGARGANGVVLITTKTGRKGSSNIGFEASVGLSNLTKRYDVLDVEEYKKALVAEGKGSSPSASYTGKGVDWQDTIFRTGITQNYKLTFSGGNDKTQYYVSGNYVDDSGIIVFTNFKRYSAKSTISSDVKPWLRITADINASHGVSHGGARFGTGKDNVIVNALNSEPTMDMMEPDGKYHQDLTSSIVARNPYGKLKEEGQDRINDVFNGRVDLRFKILPGLTFTTTNGVDVNESHSYQFTTKKVETTNSMNNNESYRMMLQSSNNLTYQGDWDKHHLTATLVGEATSSESRNMGINGSNLLTESVGYWNYAMAGTKNGSNSYSKWTMLSGVGRLIYNYADRYLFTGTMRADGSSRFLGQKWGFFPSVAFAWTASNEEFMKGINNLDELKFRTSWGIIGNQSVSPYSNLGLMSSQSFYYGGTSSVTGYWANSIPTPDVTWEKTRQLDFGVDMSLFNHKLSISADYYKKLTYDALIQSTLPYYLGGVRYWTNSGEISNTGVDVAITARPIQKRNISWSSTLNASWMKNKIEKFDNKFEWGSAMASGMAEEATIIMEGQPIGSIFGYVWTGIKDGLDTYEDLDGVAGIGGNDRKIIGKAVPDFIFGWNNSFTYKNWGMNMFFTAAIGAQRLNMVKATMASLSGDFAMITLADAYYEAGVNYPALGVAGNMPQYVSTRWMENADYLRLQNLSLYYTLRRDVTKFADVRFTLSAQNLFTLTGYTGYDPAGASRGGNADYDAGIDMGAYPTPRTITFGVRFDF